MSEYILHCGDCLDFLASVPRDAACITDPPYGMNNDTDSTRFIGGVKPDIQRGAGRDDWARITGDDRPFDPSLFLDFPKVILWGSNHYAQYLPIGTTLVWIKKADVLFGTFLSDAEIAWMKGGHGVYCFRHQFPPPSRMIENGGEVAHPNQKPIALMQWCIRRLALPIGSTIFDPYMGSGTIGIAALQMGYRYIGCEIDPGYFAIAQKRIADAAAQPPLFTLPDVPARAEQATMF